MVTSALLGAENRSNAFLSIGITLVVASLGSIWFVKRAIKRTKTVLDTYCFTITDQWVQREQYDAPSIRIPLEDIQSITHHKDGGFTIKGPGKFYFIGISKYAEPYAQLEQSLQQIRPFADFSPATNLMVKFQLVISLVVAALSMVVFLSNNKWLIVICGTLLSIYLLWYLFQQKLNKNLRHSVSKYRKSYVLLLAMVLLIMALKLLE
jgi:hypothetical protein